MINPNGDCVVYSVTENAIKFQQRYMFTARVILMCDLHVPVTTTRPIITFFAVIKNFFIVHALINMFFLRLNFTKVTPNTGEGGGGAIGQFRSYFCALVNGREAPPPTNQKGSCTRRRNIERYRTQAKERLRKKAIERSQKAYTCYESALPTSHNKFCLLNIYYIVN